MTTPADTWSEIAELIDTAWQDDVLTMSMPMLWDGVEGDAPTEGEPFARTSIRHDTGEKTTVGKGGRYRRDGSVIVQCFGRWGDGGREARKMAEVVASALDTGRTPSGAWFRNVGHQDAGRDGAYFQTNVTAAFTYQQMR